MQLSHDALGRLYDDLGHVVGKIYCPGIRPADILEIKKVEDKTVFIDDYVMKNPEELAAHVVYLQNLEQPEQRSPEWYKMRESRLTASDLAGAIGDSNYDTPFDILVKKCGGGPAFTGNVATEWGVKYEPIATSIYEQRNSIRVIEFGLLPHPFIPFLGASPDGITPAGKMLEIKCPMRRAITGVVPHHYWIQMQLQLEVCDLEECDFEECKFVEYQSAQEFYSDSNYSSVMRTKDGFEKGVLLEWYDRIESKPMYQYCPLHIRNAIDVTKWIAQTCFKIKTQDSESRYIFKTMTHWRLTLYSCVLVKRDRVWWNGVLPRIKTFWREVCYYRTQTPEVLYGDHGKAMPCVDFEDDTDAPQPPPFVAEGSPFLLASDDEAETTTSSKRVMLQHSRSEPIRTDVRFCSDTDDD